MTTCLIKKLRHICLELGRIYMIILIRLTIELHNCRRIHYLHREFQL